MHRWCWYIWCIIGFGVKENNFLGNGIGLDTNFYFQAESLKVNFLLQIQILKILINLYFIC